MSAQRNSRFGSPINVIKTERPPSYQKSRITPNYTNKSPRVPEQQYFHFSIALNFGVLIEAYEIFNT
jgi:hypothetical protein